MDRAFPRGSLQRTAALSVAGVVAAWIVLKFVLPGQAGAGTPNGLLLGGVVFGFLNGLTAMGLVLIYRTSRIINIAQAAMGAAGAIFAYNFVVVFGVPYPLAFLIGVAVAAGIGLVAELILRKLFDAPRLVVTIFTIGLATLFAQQALQGASNLPIWGEGRDLAEALGGTDIRPWPSFDFSIGFFSFEFAHVLTLMIVPACFLAIVGFLRYTRMGIAIRASAENADRAELLGINVRVLSMVVWTIAGALSGIGLTLFGTVQSFAIGGAGAPEVLILALAAAVLARMRSVGGALVAATAITVFEQAFGWSYPDRVEVIPVAMFVVIAVGMLLQRRALQRGEEEVSSWEATDEVRPTPRELLTVPGVRFWRLVLVGVGVAALLLFPWIAGTGQINLASLAAIYAIVLLSIVVLTGWAGQVSLAQFALVAVGAVVGGALTARAGVPFWFAVPIAAVITAVVAVIVGLPALRIKGLFLAVVTLAFAAATAVALFEDRYFSWLLPESIERPTLLLLDFEEERSYFYLTVVALVICIVAVVSLRRTRPGRVLIAMRENETELQSFGVNIVRTKLAAFALSGFLCGVAGALFAHHQRAISATAFTASASIDVFVFAVIGGLSSVSGALLGSMLQAVESLIPQTDGVIAFFVNRGVALLVVLYIAPGGLTAIAYGIRDSILRIVAQRRQLVVPALFEDVDPEALENRLIPLGEGARDGGLSAVPGGRRYRMGSELYDRDTDGGVEKRSQEDRRAFEAAVKAATEGEG